MKDDLRGHVSDCCDVYDSMGISNGCITFSAYPCIQSGSIAPIETKHPELTLMWFNLQREHWVKSLITYETFSFIF